jgi:hypothetical protein
MACVLWWTNKKKVARVSVLGAVEAAAAQVVVVGVGVGVVVGWGVGVVVVGVVGWVVGVVGKVVGKVGKVGKVGVVAAAQEEAVGVVVQCISLSRYPASKPTKQPYRLLVAASAVEVPIHPSATLSSARRFATFVLL